VRGGEKLQRRCMRPPLTLTLSPRKSGERGSYVWLAAIRSKSPRSTASSLPVRQLPFMLRTSGEGSLR
jgi:hypothetical protein